MKGLEYAQLVMELAKATTELNIAHKQQIAELEMARLVMPAMGIFDDRGSGEPDDKLKIHNYHKIEGRPLGTMLTVSEIEEQPDKYKIRISDKSDILVTLYLERTAMITSKGKAVDTKIQRYKLYVADYDIPYNVSFQNDMWTGISSTQLKDMKGFMNSIWTVVLKYEREMENINAANDAFKITFK